MARPTPNQPTVPQTVPIVILGTDAVLAALPATPVQLAHACLRAGFASVIPASWGDELIAAAVLNRLPQFGNGPAIQCSCPIVAHRLLAVGGDLRPAMLSLVPPPVALARYVRKIARPARARITYVGACPGAVDASIDIRMSPESLISMLAERDIVLEEQPRVFESIIPPDRRRFRSQPGGVPAADALWSELGSRTLVEIDGEDFVTEVAQHLLTGKNVLIDASTRLGCACAGAVGGATDARAQVVALEPPRASSAVVDESPSIDLELPVPAAPRTPVDVVAVPPQPAPPPVATTTPPHAVEAVAAPRVSQPRANAPSNDPRPPRHSTPVVHRSVLSAFPVARDAEGRALPRAYVVRRRPSPKGVSFVVPPEESPAPTAPAAASPEPGQPAPESTPGPATDATTHAAEATASPTPTPVPTPTPALASSSARVAATAYTPVRASPTTPEPSRPWASAGRATPVEPLAAEISHPPRTTPSERSSVRQSYPESWSAPPATPPLFSRKQVMLMLGAFAVLVIAASVAVAVVVARSVNNPPAATAPQNRP